jgi:class 3 adenylate cyclase
VASRVEGLTKERGLAVLVTGAIVDRLAHPERYRLRKLAEPVQLRGRADVVDLYTLDED